MIHRLFKHATKHATNFHSANPKKVAPHAAAAVLVGSMAWAHGPRVAKHTTQFMTKAALKGFNLFRS